MAKRLRALREARGLSHDKLSKALKERYEIRISSDSLMNYEVADTDHSKKYKNMGMRVEYLRCLADFYGVSTDWLLDLSEEPIPDSSIQGACTYTRLSGMALLQLRELPPKLLDIADHIISHESFCKMLYQVYSAWDLRTEMDENDLKIAQIEESADKEIEAAQDFLKGNFIESMPYDVASDLYLENAKSIFGKLIQYEESWKKDSCRLPPLGVPYGKQQVDEETACGEDNSKLPDL